MPAEPQIEAPYWREDSRPVVYTLGTSTRSAAAFGDVLRAHGIAVVADVRHFPGSRRYPHFGRDAMVQWLAAAGFDYVWLGEELGGYRRGGYEAHMRSDAFARGRERLEALARVRPAAIVCAERLPWRCHRRFIAAALEGRGWRVTHIIDAGRTWRPKGSVNISV